MQGSEDFPKIAWRPGLAWTAILVAVFAVALIARIRLLDAPLERDEGEHAYLGQLMLAGHVPWQQGYNMKLPGTDAAYALSMAVFGQTASAIRVGLLLANAATIALLWLIGLRILGPKGATAATACYTLLSVSQNIFGTIAHSTHFVVLFALLGTLILLKRDVRPFWMLLSGLAYGLAFLMKQPGIAFGAFGFLYLVLSLRRQRASLKAGIAATTAFTAGVCLPYGLLCIWLWREGVFARFWFWTVTLARTFAGQFSFFQRYQALTGALGMVTGPNLPLWILAGAGLGFAFSVRATRGASFFIGLFLLFSSASVAAGGVFNPHYFILMLPAIALATGCGVEAVDSTLRGHGFPVGVATIVCFSLASLWSVVAQKEYLFSMNPYRFSRDTYGLNPFPEAVRISDYIRAHSAENARIAVLGSEAEIYFYSRRAAGTGYLFTYGLMEENPLADSLQGEMIGEIVASRPEYIVFVAVPTSWLARPASSRTIFDWAQDYTQQNYERVGVVDLGVANEPLYIWGPAAVHYKTRNPNLVLTVFRRK